MVRGGRAASLIAVAVAAAFLLDSAQGHARLHTRSCDEQPTRALYPKILHNSGGALATLPDGEGGAEFQVKDSSGELVTAYNPGGAVVVYAVVPTLATAVVLVPTGQLQDSSGKPADGCEGRRLYLGEGSYTGYLPNSPTRRFAFIWTVPADATGTLTLSLGYSDNSGHAIMDARLTLTQGEPYVAPLGSLTVEETPPSGLQWQDISLEVMSTVTLLAYMASLIVGHHLVARLGWAATLNRWLYYRKGTEGAVATAILPTWVTVGDVVVVVVTAVFLCLGFALPTSNAGSVAARLGWVCTMSMTITMLPTGHRSFFAAMLKVPFDQMVHLHRWSGRVFTAFTLVHGIQAGCAWGWDRIARMMGSFAVVPGYGYNLCVLSGVLSFFLFLVVTVLGTEPVRRRCWEAFRYAHHLVFPAVILAILHAPRSVWVVCITLVAWLIDGTWRLWGKDYAYQGTLQVLSGDAVRVHVPGKGLRFSTQRAGQYVILRIPGANKLQWHPLTISSSPLEDSLDFIVSARGNWGHALLQYARDGLSGSSSASDEKAAVAPSESMRHLTSYTSISCPSCDPMVTSNPESAPAAASTTSSEVEEPSQSEPCLDAEAVKRAWLGPGLPMTCNLDGPYGGVPIEILQKDVVLLVAGGVGVTPILSTAAYLCAWAEAGNNIALPHVHFVWMARGAAPFNDWNPELLHRMSALPTFSVHLYDTTAKLEGRVGDAEDPEQSVPLHPGRCALSERFQLQQLAEAHHDSTRALTPSSVGIFLCGPPTLRAAAADLSTSQGYMMHVDKFEW